MVWIESHLELESHPKVDTLADRLDVSYPEALGMLHLLWYFTARMAPEGDLSRFSARQIARAMHYQSDADVLLSALRESGFLDDNVVHDWGVYYLFHAQRREAYRRANAEKQRRWRERRRDARALAELPAAATASADEEHNRYVTGYPSVTHGYITPRTGSYSSTGVRPGVRSSGDSGSSSGTPVLEPVSGSSQGVQDDARNGDITLPVTVTPKAPRRPRKPATGPALGPLIDAFDALGLTRPALLRAEPKAAQDLLRAFSPEQIASGWQWLQEHGDTWTRGNLSFNALATNNRLANALRDMQAGTNGAAGKRVRRDHL